MKAEKQASKPRKSKAQPSGSTRDLKQVELHVNEFGEIVRDFKTEEINAFLDENVPDKKIE